MSHSTWLSFVVVAVSIVLCVPLRAETPAGESPRLGTDRIRQEQIERGELSLIEIRRAGLRVFTSPFNKLDGYGDGELDPIDTVQPGGRPTLQGNGTFLRVNGLDAQTCLECHFLVSSASTPPTLGIGGVGGANSNAMIQATAIDPADLEDLDGRAGFDGRFANPPFLFGAGAVELLALEMSAELQGLAAKARGYPGVPIELQSKGVSFGRITADAHGELDTSEVLGVGNDLVVRPFGRKGEFASVREFDRGAMQFHFGLQPVEDVGPGTDPDLDGVRDEILPGELSALSIFAATLERPRADPLSAEAARGFQLFHEVGCAACHIPELQTTSRELPMRYPEVPADPASNVYYRVDLTRPPMRFERTGQGGIRVPLFADLKRHDMGDGLAESFARADARTNREYTTARLWGIADTAPYLHDGRATTLTEAILLHAGEGQAACDGFGDLEHARRLELLAFLRSLRTPPAPAANLMQRHGRETVEIEPR